MIEPVHKGKGPNENEFIMGLAYQVQYYERIEKYLKHQSTGKIIWFYAGIYQVSTIRKRVGKNNIKTLK